MPSARIRLWNFFLRAADAVRTGAYMDRDRALVGAAIFGAFALAAFLLVLITSDGVKDWMGRPLGTDFIAFYAGGKVALAEGGAASYDVFKVFAAHQNVLADETPNWGPFFYPPIFLPVAMAFASLPYAAAWLAWMAATGALYVAAISKIAPSPHIIIPALGFSAVFMNLMQGQTGFLAAGLFGGGLVALFAGRGALAGVLLGLIAFKPQFGILIPVALAAGGHWRAFLFATLTVAATIIIPTIAFSPEVWPAFARAATIARIEVLEKGGIGYFKIASVFSQARMFGAPLAVAYVAQGATAIAAAATVFAVWRGRAPDDLKGVVLILAALIAAPYVVEYDLVLLAPAAAFLIADAQKTGFRDYEKSLLILIFFAPALTRPLTSATSVSLGLVALLLFAAATLARLRPPSPPLAQPQGRD